MQKMVFSGHGIECMCVSGCVYIYKYNDFPQQETSDENTGFQAIFTETGLTDWGSLHASWHSPLQSLLF